MAEGFLGSPVGAGGGAGDPLLGSPAAAASATLPSQQEMLQLAQLMSQQLGQTRQQGLGTGLIPGASIAKPIAPLPPTHAGGPGIAQGPFGSVGQRKRADKQALFGTIKDLVDKAQDKLYQKKVQTIQHDFETLSAAIQGYNEGKSTGNQALIDHNTQVINSIVMDPKKGKELSKAFDVNMNPMAQDKKKEKPNPANDALKAAYTKDLQAFQEATSKGQTALAPQAQAMMRAMPQTLQPDPRFQQYLEATKAGVYPKAGEELTFQKDLLQIQQRIRNNELTNETREKVAQMFAGARDRATQASLLRTAMTVQGAGDRQGILEKMWKYRADKLFDQFNQRTQAMKDKIKASAGAGDDKKLNTLVNGLDKTSAELNKQLESARKAHDTTKMGQITQQLESIGIMQQMANAEVAKRLGMNPEDFDQEQFKLTDEMMRNYEALFPDAPPVTTEGADAADQ